MSSELEELTKLPEENIVFDMDFSKRMTGTETIAGITSSEFTNVGRVDGSSDINLSTPSYSGNITQIRISGGTSNEQYIVKFVITTTYGNTKVGKGLLRIE